MSANLVTARRLRRKLIKELQLQQEVDSRQAAKLKEQFLSGHKKLMVAIGELLGTFGSEIAIKDGNVTVQISEEQKAAFSEICTDVSIDEWLAARLEEAKFSLLLKFLRGQLAVAEGEFGKVAPLGSMISKWGSTQSEKDEIVRKKSERDSLRAKLKIIESQYESVHTVSQRLVERCMKAAMHPESLHYLVSAASPVRTDIIAILSEMEETITDTWNSTRNEQSKSLEATRSYVEALSSVYEQPTNHLLKLLTHSS